MPPFLQNLWMGMTTRDVSEAGTNDNLALTVMEDGADRLYWPFPPMGQSLEVRRRQQEQGDADFYQEAAHAFAARISPERFVVVGLNSLGNERSVVALSGFCVGRASRGPRDNTPRAQPPIGLYYPGGERGEAGCP
jgi:hypothetical protein